MCVGQGQTSIWGSTPDGWASASLHQCQLACDMIATCSGIEWVPSGLEKPIEDVCAPHNGILNYPEESRDVCCQASCGKCGGAGCSSRPGGASACCVNTIRSKAQVCGGDVKAPCKRKLNGPFPENDGVSRCILFSDPDGQVAGVATSDRYRDSVCYGRRDALVTPHFGAKHMVREFVGEINAVRQGWATIWGCNGRTDRMRSLFGDWRPLAVRAAGLRICTLTGKKNAEEFDQDCVYANEDSDVIDELWKAAWADEPLHLQPKRMECDLACIKERWNGPEERLKAMTWKCQDNWVVPDAEDHVYHACGNSDGLHIWNTNAENEFNGQCTWDWTDTTNQRIVVQVLQTDMYRDYPHVRGGDGWIEIGDWRMGEWDSHWENADQGEQGYSHFTICNKYGNRRTAATYRSDGKKLAASNSRCHFDSAYGVETRPSRVLFGHNYVQLGNWRWQYRPDSEDMVLMYMDDHYWGKGKYGPGVKGNEEFVASLLIKKDGRFVNGPVPTSTHWRTQVFANRNTVSNVKFGDTFIQIGDYRIASMDHGRNDRRVDEGLEKMAVWSHLSVSRVNSGSAVTSIIYRGDGTIHAGPRYSWNGNHAETWGFATAGNFHNKLIAFKNADSGKFLNMDATGKVTDFPAVSEGFGMHKCSIFKVTRDFNSPQGFHLKGLCKEEGFLEPHQIAITQSKHHPEKINNMAGNLNEGDCSSFVLVAGEIPVSEADNPDYAVHFNIQTTCNGHSMWLNTNGNAGLYFRPHHNAQWEVVEISEAEVCKDVKRAKLMHYEDFVKAELYTASPCECKTTCLESGAYYWQYTPSWRKCRCVSKGDPSRTFVRRGEDMSDKTGDFYAGQTIEPNQAKTTNTAAQDSADAL